jgi:hypothetical protein
MSYNTDRMSIDRCHPNWQQHPFSRCGATPPDDSVARADSNLISGWREHYTLFGLTCDSDLSNLSQSESHLGAGLFTPESHSVPSPPSLARSSSTVRWVSDSGGAARPLHPQNAKDRKERRRAQNRVAQRGAHPFFCCGLT